MNKPQLPFVETMITQVCNLSCAGCTNYSDLQHEGYVTWAQGKEWLEAWLDRVEIPDFGIIGGEPTINPEVSDWIYGVRQLLPDAQIRFTTNGLLLNKKYELVQQLADIGNCIFKITVHQQNSEIEQVIDRILSTYNWKPVTEYGIERFRTDNDFCFQINRPTTFWKTFKGDYEDMQPHHSVPEQAFDICCQKTCPLLYNGKIYKCSTSGLLADTLSKFNNPNFDQWSQYIPLGLASDCSQIELLDFIENFGKANSICRQCPTDNDLASKLEHSNTVSTWKIKWK
jgi:hypothetical protein